MLTLLGVRLRLHPDRHQRTRGNPVAQLYIHLRTALERHRPRPRPHHRAARPASPLRRAGAAAGRDAAGVLAAHAPCGRGGDRVDMQPHRALRQRCARTRRRCARLARRTRRHRCAHRADAHLSARRRQRRAACIPRRERPRFDGAGRAADPRPVQACAARGRERRHAGHDAAPVVPAHLRRRERGAHADAHRRRVGEPCSRGGEARRAAVRGSGGCACAVRRRGRDDRTRGDALRRISRVR